MIHSIITNNCYGIKYYTDKKFKYKTPFIGLFFFAPCYINFLENYNNYIDQEIIEVKKVNMVILIIQLAKLEYLKYIFFMKKVLKKLVQNGIEEKKIS